MNSLVPFEMPTDLTSWARLIDHTLLKPDTTAESVKNLVREAWDWGFWSVCLYPSWLSHARQLLTELWEGHLASHTPKFQQTEAIHLPQLCAVVGFPSGAQTSKIKLEETQDAIQWGAQEIDWVIPIGYYLSGGESFRAVIKKELKEMVHATRFEGALSKVIIETSFLSGDQIRELSGWCAEAGADFVKTSTGFGFRGASLEDIQIIAETLKGTRTQIKASGGIRDFKTALMLVQAGAHRIGSSASVKIMQEMQMALFQRPV